MRTVLFLLSLCLIACAGKDHSGKAGSLPQPDKQASLLVKDTARIKAYINNAYDSGATNPALGEFYYRLAYEESSKISYHDGIIIAVLGITNRLFEQGNYDSCEFYYDIAEKNLAAIDFEPRLVPSFYLNKGSYFYFRGDLVNADKCYYEGLQQASAMKLENSDLPLQLLYNLSYTRMELKQPDLALEFLNQAAALCTPGFTDKLPMILAAKADIFLKLDRMDSAGAIIRKIIASGTLDFNDAEVITNYYLKTGQPEKAIPYLQKQIDAGRKAQIDFEENRMLVLLARVFQEKGKYREADQLLSDALKESLEKNLHASIPFAFDALIQNKKRRGDYQAAVQLLEQKKGYDDSVLNESNRKTLNDLNVRYKSAEKDRQLSASQLMITGQKNALFKQRLLLVIITSALLLTIMLAVLLRRSAVQKTRMKEKDLALLRQQTQIISLESKMEGEENERQRLSRELHDGIGSMITAALLQLDKYKKSIPAAESQDSLAAISDLLQATATDVKRTAGNLMPDALYKAGLAQAIQEYALAIQGPANLSIDVQAYGELDRISYSFQLIFYRVVQELIHNAVKHAGAKHVLVQLALNDDVFSITAEDDGKGFDKQVKNPGLGLNNIINRVRELGGEIMIETAPAKGVSVYIEFDRKRIVNHE